MEHAGLPIPRKKDEFIKNFHEHISPVKDDRLRICPPKREFPKNPNRFTGTRTDFEVYREEKFDKKYKSQKPGRITTTMKEEKKRLFNLE